MGRILVLDDEPSMGTVLQIGLARAGHEVDAEARPSRALDRIRANRYDLAISDLKMPDISGIEVLKQTRHDQRDRAGTVLCPYLLTSCSRTGSIALFPTDSGTSWALNPTRNTSKNRPDFVPGLEQMGGKGIPERVATRRLADAGPSHCKFDRPLQHRLVQVVASLFECGGVNEAPRRRKDELTQFTLRQWQTMTAWNRSPAGPGRMAGATNPIGVGHSWVNTLWIDKEPAPGMERPDEYYPADYEFIPALYTDNPIYANDASYKKTLESLPTHIRAATLTPAFALSEENFSLLLWYKRPKSQAYCI